MIEEVLYPIVCKINEYLSNYILVFLLIGVGLWYSIRTRFVQVRCFGEAMQKTFGGLSLKGGAQKSGMTSFQALATAIAAQVGTGNIVGASGAILTGGPGAIFWMWLIAFFGMATIYAEATLAQKTRIVDKDGTVHGGPVYYITTAFKGGFGKFLAGFFAVAIILALGLMGSMVQSNSIGSFGMIFKYAFNPSAIIGGGIGYALKTAISQGAKRGLFSNEAGMGSTPHAHAQANVAHPHDQGVVAMAGVFIDTFVVLTLNALVIISTLYTPGGPLHECGAAAANTALNKTNLAQAAFGTVFGETFGNMFVAVCLFFFAFSTVLGWNLFGRINANYLFGRKNTKLCNTVYTIIALVFIFLGTLTGNDLVWELTDMFNNLIVLPNARALFALTGLVITMLREGQAQQL